MENKSLQLTDADRINQLVDDYYNQLGKGCLPALTDLVSGKTKRRATEISKLTGIGDERVVTQLFTSINLVCFGSKTKEEASQKLVEGFLRGTNNGQNTGKNPTTNRKIENIATLAKRALDKNWEIRERRLNQK